MPILTIIRAIVRELVNVVWVVGAVKRTKIAPDLAVVTPSVDGVNVGATMRIKQRK